MCELSTPGDMGNVLACRPQLHVSPAAFSREGGVPTGAFPIQLCAAAADISFYSQICFLGNE